MARDPGLEDVLAEDLADVPGLTTRPMFGGLVWLHDGRLLCGARRDGLLIRLGLAEEGWALATAGVAPMMSGARRMTGWVWAGAAAYADDAVRRRLLTAALGFVRTLPPKAVPLPAVPWDFPEQPEPARRRPHRAIKS